VRDLARFLALRGRLGEALATLDAAMATVREPQRLAELKDELDRDGDPAP
jgi:hypothetical protein